MGLSLEDGYLRFKARSPESLENGFEKVGKKQCNYGSLEYKESAEAIKVPEPAACYLPGIQLMSFTTPWQKE